MTAAECREFLRIVREYRDAYHELSALPAGDPRRAGVTAAKFAELREDFDALLASLGKVLPYLDEE